MTSKEYCWSCGQYCTGCKGCHTTPCCDNPNPVKVNYPESVPPPCGSPHSEKLAVIERDTHFCCRCGKQFKSTYQQWIDGPCPYCGAKGYNGLD